MSGAVSGEPMDRSYYSPSGRISPKVLLFAPLAFPLAAVAATIYSYVTLYLPIIGYVTVLLTAGLGFLIGSLSTLVLERSKARSRLFATVLSLGLGLFTTWSMWVTWGYALAQRAGSDIQFWALLWPPNLWDLVNAVNEHGSWSFKGLTPTGGVLWVLWTIEAGLLTVLPLVMGLSVADQPFCEHCDRWCEHTPALFLTPAVKKEEAAEHLKQRDFAWLQGLGVARSSLAHFTRWDLYECGCRATNAVSAIDIEVGVDDNGKQKVTETPLVQTFLLAPDVVPCFRQLAQSRA